jgi:hypothetical protein
MIRFSENISEPLTPLPPWARYFIRAGVGAVLAQEPGRRISLFSMPCESVAAGLVCLGSVAAGLTLPHESMLENHFDGLWRSARQYLTACRKCKYRCEPQYANCGYTDEAKGLFKKANQTAAYKVKSALEQPAGVRVIEMELPRKSLSMKCLRGNAVDWRIADQPQFVIAQGGEAIERAPYVAVMEGIASVQPHQCFASAADVCLVARVAGASVTQQALAASRVELPSGASFQLDRLLRMHEWQDSTAISRSVLYNPRTRVFDRNVPVRLAVADGAPAFLAALSEKRFASSHIIGVMSRVADREQLVEIEERLSGFSQWYADNAAYPGLSGQQVAGIGFRSMYRVGG